MEITNAIRQKVADYVKGSGRYTSREQVIKGMTENPGEEIRSWGLTETQVKELVNNTLWPGEHRKGDVIFTQSVRGDVYTKVGTEYPSYKVERFGDSQSDTYRVVRYDEPDGDSWKPVEKVLVKNVPVSWARQYALNKLDSSLPRPAKLEGREKMKYGKTKARAVSSLSALLSEGVPSKGFDVKDLESRPVLLFKGAENSVLTDGFMLIHDKDVAESILEKRVEQLRKGEAATLRKVGNLSADEADKKADEYISEQRKGNFPDWKQLVPKMEIKGWEPAGTSITGDGRLLAWFVSPDGKFIPVDLDKLAFIYKNVPGIDSIQSGAFDPQRTGSWGSGEPTDVHSGVLAFYQGDTLKALLMPIFSPVVPDVVRQNAMRIIRPPSVSAQVTKTGKEATEKSDVAPSLQTLQDFEQSRSELSRDADERQSNQDTVEQDDPRVAAWMKRPGSMDVRGVDTPKRSKKDKASHRRKPVRVDTTLSSVSKRR